MSKKKSAFELLADDLAKFYSDPYGFVLWAFPWGKGTLKNHEGPREWQKKYLVNLGNEVKKRSFDGVNPVAPIQIAITSGHGVGKAKCLDSIVFLKDKSIKLRDLKEGDEIASPNGFTKVIKLHPISLLETYRVYFDDNSFVDVSGDHLWNVRGRNERRTGRTNWLTLSTYEIIKKGVKRSNGASEAKQWEIPKHEPVSFSEQCIPVKPYTFGAWLGNGCKGTNRISVSYQETIEKIKEEYPNCSVNHSKNIFTVCLKGEAKNFKTLECIDCYSHEKYIPDVYKYNSVKNRIELLRGMLDTDGEVNNHGSITYSSTSKKLADDIIWLARSLGLKAMMQPTPKQGKIGSVDYKLCYRVTISPNGKFHLFYTKARLSRVKETVEIRYNTRWIDKIESLGEKYVRCITVEAEDGLYLTNDFIVTHNSAISSWLILWIMSTRPFAKGVVTANTGDQLKTKTWSEVQKWLQISLIKDLFKYSQSKGNMSLISTQYPATWRCDAMTCREENSEAFAGLHAANSTPFYLFDEASAIPEKIHEVAKGGLTDGEPMFFMFGNPTRNSGSFYDAFGRNSHRWLTGRLNSEKVEGTNKALFKEWEKDYGRDSDFYKVRVLGEAPSASITQLIPNDLVQKALSNIIPEHTYAFAPIVLGVDVAWEGDDRSCIWMRQGLLATLLWVGREVDSIQIAGLVTRYEIEYSVNAVFVDAGYGNGVIDQLRALGRNPTPVWFAGKSNDPSCLNKRAEMWHGVLSWLKSNPAISSKSNYKKDIETDLCGVEKMHDLNGKIQLEKKSSMKKRGLASPDLGDGLALTFAMPVTKDTPRQAVEKQYTNINRAKTDYDVLG